jgi:NADH:ubiquinone oxidoreductase subunit 2 (subunit N)
MNNQRVDARMIHAFLACAATGIVVYLIAIRGALPLLTRRLTPEQIDWLRGAFNAHPWAALCGIAMVAAILALPVLVAFRIAYGPMKDHWRRRPL